MGDTAICDICGKPSKVRIGDSKAAMPRNLCFNCHNREMAELFDLNKSDNIPERLTITGSNGEHHEFDIEFAIFGTGKSLTATEVGKFKRKADVWSLLDDDFEEMLNTLKERIKKALSVEYMDEHGRIKDQKLVGYVDYDGDLDECVIFVDGKPYTWDELGRSTSAFEGFKIKIEFGSIGDELD